MCSNGASACCSLIFCIAPEEQMDANSFLKEIKKHPDHFYIIHYSSENLFDETTEGMTPRITSVVASHYATGQLQSFAIHTAADVLNIPRPNVAAQYDAVEREMLRQLYEFMGPRTQHFWIHWNMRRVTFGFEHLAHRYHTLSGVNAPTVPVENRINLNDVLREKYGPLYANHPQMQNLMLLQGNLPLNFLSGEQESASFARQEFIRMHQSTISKVQFFRFAIGQLIKGKLKTAGLGVANRIDRLLSSHWARVLTFITSVFGLGSWLVFFAVKAFAFIH
jgi:hypothetical protein